MDYSKEKNLKKLVKFSPNEQMAANDAESLYFAGQSQYEQDSINKAQKMTGEPIGEDLNALWESAAPQEDLNALWESATPQASNKPLTVTRNGKTLTASNKTFQDDLRDELEANPIAAKMAAAGTALSDLYQGGKQLFGMGDDKAIEANRIIREANPMSAIGGNVAAFAAGGVAAPVLNTLKGVTALGAATGLAAPVEGEDVVRQKIGNALVGAGVGAGANKVAGAIGNALTTRATNKAVEQAQNATRDTTLKAAQKSGFTVPRSLYNPSFISNRIESLGGKAATKQVAREVNQKAADNLARKTLGVSIDTPMDETLLAGLRQTASAPYKVAEQLQKQIVGQNTTKSLSTGKTIQTPIIKDGKQLVQEINEARDKTRALWSDSKSSTGTARNAAREAAKESEKQLAKLESQLDDMAIKQGKPDLVNKLSEARKQIAKIYSVDDALNKSTGSIDALVLARKFQKGKLLDDNLKSIGKFANEFREVAPRGGAMQGADVSALEPLATAIYSGAGSAATGNATGMLLGGVPLLRSPARNLALSKLMSKDPKYKTGTTANLLKALVSSRNAPVAITGATMPALTQ